MGSAENNSPAVKSVGIGTKNSSEIKARVNGQNGPSIPLDLVGGSHRWPGARLLDPDLVARILATEIGVSTGTATSTDSITVTVTPTHWVRR